MSVPEKQCNGNCGLFCCVPLHSTKKDNYSFWLYQERGAFSEPFLWQRVWKATKSFWWFSGLLTVSLWKIFYARCEQKNVAQRESMWHADERNTPPPWQSLPTVHVVMETFKSLGSEVLLHLPYTPDLIQAPFTCLFLPESPGRKNLWASMHMLDICSNAC